MSAKDAGTGNDSAPKEAVGKYRDVAELGRGGMGEVVLSIASASIGDAGFDKLLVRKRLHAGLADDKEILKMFLREARLAVRLNHPNVVQSYEVGFDGDRHFIAMEYLEGQSLHGVIKRTQPNQPQSGRPFPLDMHVLVLAEACAGLHYAHELTDFDGTPLGIIHRDATPHNIFITYDGQVKVVDFGVAKIANSDTQSGFLKGKLPYMSPEQAIGRKIDRRADVFTIGVCLWEAATGRRLWKDETDLEISRRLEEGMIPALRAAKPDCPEQLAEIISRALAVNPEERYPTAAALQADLEKYLQDSAARVTARDVGRYVASIFGDTRVRIHSIIDAELKKYHEPSNASMHSPVAIRTKMLSLAPQGPDVTPSRSIPRREGTINSSNSSLSLPSEPTPKPRKKRAATGAVILVVVVLAVAFALLEFARQPEATTTSAPTQSAPVSSKVAPPSIVAPPSTAPVIASTSATSPETVQLTVQVAPSEASIELDGAPLVGNPHVSTMLRDGASHRVRAEAPGYQPKTEWVTFDQPTMVVKLVLERAPKGTVAPPPPSATTTAPAPTSSPSRAPLDHDPWTK